MSERNNSGELQVPQFMYNTQRRTNEKNFRESLKYIPDQQSNSHRYSDVNHSVRRTKEARNNNKIARHKKLALLAISASIGIGILSISHSNAHEQYVSPEAIEDQQLNNYIDEKTTDFLAQVQAMKEAYSENSSCLSDEEVEKIYNEYVSLAKDSIDSKIAKAYTRANPDKPLEAKDILIAQPTQNESFFRIGTGNNQYTYGSHVKFDHIISADNLPKELDKAINDFCNASTTSYSKFDHDNLSLALNKLNSYAENLDNLSSYELSYTNNPAVWKSSFVQTKLPAEYFRTQDLKTLKESYKSQYLETNKTNNDVER